MCNNPILDLVNINTNIKFGENLSILSQDIERKRNVDGLTDNLTDGMTDNPNPIFSKPLVQMSENDM